MSSLVPASRNVRFTQDEFETAYQISPSLINKRTYGFVKFFMSILFQLDGPRTMLADLENLKVPRLRSSTLFTQPEPL